MAAIHLLKSSMKSLMKLWSYYFPKTQYRNRGQGTAIVKKLLTLSPCENVYLVCEEHNLDFYENIGFEKVGEIYEYKSKG